MSFTKEVPDIEEPEQSRGDWRLDYESSPDSLEQVDDLLFSHTQMIPVPIVVAVKYEDLNDQKVVGVSYADATTKLLGVSEFLDNELFTNLEYILIQLGAKECLLPDATESDSYVTTIREILERCNIVVKTKPKSDFDSKNILQDMDCLLKRNLSLASMPEYGLKDAMLSCACVIKHLNLLSDDSNYGQFELQLYDPSQFLKLNASAVVALNLMPRIRDGSYKNASLYSLLNQCKTAQGSRMMEQWIKQPLLNITEIEKRHDIVQVLCEDSELRQSLQEYLSTNVPDLLRLSKRFHKRIGTLQDAVRVYLFCIGLPAMFTCIQQRLPSNNSAKADLFEATYLKPIGEAVTKFQGLENLVERSIDLEDTEHQEYMIKAKYSPELQQIRAELDQIQSDIDKEFAKVGGDDSKVKLERDSIFGHCLCVSRTDYSKFESEENVIQHVVRQYDVLFSTFELRILSQSYTDLSESYDKAQKDTIKEVMDVIATYCGTMEDIGRTIAHLDILVSFAHVAVMAPTQYIRPKLSPLGQGNVILKKARHPCLEVRDFVSFVPTDVSLERDSSDFQIITGRNMGGKSTYICQVGVIALMTQIGCFVPCKEAQLCLFDSILTVSGNSNGEFKGDSSFFDQFQITASILESATKNSLIIIDELGKGTSTSDGLGLGLAWDISQHIATEIKCFCFFATNFHELTELSDSVSCVKNLSLSFHIDNEREAIFLYIVLFRQLLGHLYQTL